MIYYRRYVGDYLKKTPAIAMLEHGAYGLLLDYYYVEEHPIPLDLNEVFRMVRAITAQERQAVTRVLFRYFTKRDDGYHNKRADEEIALAVQARLNGGNGGRPPKTRKVTGDVTGTETGNVTGHRTGEGGETGHPSTTNHQPSASNRQPSVSGAGAPPDGFEILWKTLPRRAGNNPKRAAEKAYRARISEKHTPQELLDGAGRYARFIRATGKEGTEYAMRGSTFLGADKPFMQAWDVPSGPGAAVYVPKVCAYCQKKSIGNVNRIEHCDDHSRDAMDQKPRPDAQRIAA